MELEKIKEKLKVFNQVTFEDEGHKYYFKGKEIKGSISTTSLIHSYANEFDESKFSVEKVAEWHFERDYSCIKGDIIHLYCQDLWAGRPFKNRILEADIIYQDRLNIEIPILMKQADKFYEDYKDKLELVQDELLLYDEDYNIFGAIDLLFYNKLTGKLVICDLKSNKEIKYEAYRKQKMLVPLHNLQDCNYYHYSLQVYSYKKVLEKNTGLKTEEPFIIHFDVSKNDYTFIEPKKVDKEVNKILENRKERIMGKCIPILIIGKSGSGKSTSLRNLKKEDYSLVNVLNKDLPFKGGRNIASLSTKNYEDIKKFIEATPKDIIIVDDFGYVMTDEFVSKATETGYTKFSVIAQKFYNFIEFIKKLDGDKRVYLMMHEEKDDSGEISVKTCGKMLNSQICVEGLFGIVLRSLFDGKEYRFKTKTDGLDICKTPVDMINDEFIDNDLALVDNAICEYYEIKKENKKDEGK